jgi:hypothetical protein
MNENISRFEMSLSENIISHLLLTLESHKEEPTGGGMYYIDEDEILEIKNNKPKPAEPDYCRTWYKLNKSQKINRLIVYAQKLTKEYNLTQEQQIQLKQLFMNIFNMDHTDDVDYDVATGRILKIKNLQRSMDGQNEFFITASDKPKSTFSLEGTPMVPLTMGELISATNGHVLPPLKKKILVKKKTL